MRDTSKRIYWEYLIRINYAVILDEKEIITLSRLEHVVYETNRTYRQALLSDLDNIYALTAEFEGEYIDYSEELEELKTISSRS